MQVNAKSHRKFSLVYHSSKAEGDTYIKELLKAHRKNKGSLPTVKAYSVLDIFTFTSYVIQVLWLSLKDIVDEWKDWTDSVEAQETDLFHHLLKITCKIISFYAQYATITQDGITTSAQFIELTKTSRS